MLDCWCGLLPIPWIELFIAQSSIILCLYSLKTANAVSYCLRIIRVKGIEALPSNPVQAVFSPLNVSSTSTASAKKVGRPGQQRNPKTKQMRHKQQPRREKDAEQPRRPN